MLAQSTVAELLAGPVGPGTLAWIGLRPSRGAAMVAPDAATLVAMRGIAGDHYQTERNGARQVTLIAAEDVAAVASFLRRAEISPDLLRRNLLTRGINLIALKGQRVRIGSVILEITGECAPCSRMEANLGPGGYNALRGRGGLRSRIIEAGNVRIGDAVERV